MFFTFAMATNERPFIQALFRSRPRHYRHSAQVIALALSLADMHLDIQRQLQQALEALAKRVDPDAALLPELQASAMLLEHAAEVLATNQAAAERQLKGIDEWIARDWP